MSTEERGTVAERKIEVMKRTIKGCLSMIEPDLEHTKQIVEKYPDFEHAKVMLEHYESKKQAYEFFLGMLEDEGYL